MSKITLYVGLDYHQRAVQVCVMNGRGEILVNTVARNVAEEVVAAAAVSGARVEAGIEACTGAANLADELLKLRRASGATHHCTRSPRLCPRTIVTLSASEGKATPVEMTRSGCMQPRLMRAHQLRLPVGN